MEDKTHRSAAGAARVRPRGAVVVATALSLIALLVLLTNDRALADSPLPGKGTVAAAFDSAARHWDVPAPLLMAIGYVESHWEQRHGAPSLDGGYGIMHLTDGVTGTLALASRLTGLPADALKQYAPSNIEGGAAVLHDISLKLTHEPQTKNNLTLWFTAVMAYSGATDPGVRDAYARDVFRLLASGVSATISTGERIELGAQSLGGALPASQPQPASDDYDPALWVPADPNNYTAGRPYGPLNFIIIHDTEGSYYSAINWFQNPSSGVSAHYVIRSSDGQITQMVRNADTAYHAGNWDYNVRAIGVEHEGYMNQQGWYTEAMYQSSAALVRTMADRYGIKKDRAHIIGHYQVPGSDHHDPGPYWDWTHYMSLVRRDSEMAALVDNTDPGFSAVPPQIDPGHYWWVYGNGYNGSSTLVTGSVADQSQSQNSGTWTTSLPATGWYDLYAFIPWVDNNTPDTSSARYQVQAGDGLHTVTVSQSAITDVGNGSWAQVGRFYFDGSQQAQVTLTDYTGETGRNVWFDAMMWIPAASSAPTPTAQPTSRPTATRTPTHVPVRTATRTATRTPRASATATPRATQTPGPCGMSFSDLQDTHWAYNYIAYLYCRQVVSGYADGTFRPENSNTRGQFTKMLVLALGWTPYNPVTPTFSDVAPDNSFYTYVEEAFLRGVIGGYNDGTFRPNSPLTRAQAAKILVLAEGWSQEFPPNPSFIDVPPSDWAYGYIESAFQHGVMGGYADGTFHPGFNLTRAQLSKMLYTAMQMARVRATPVRR